MKERNLQSLIGITMLFSFCLSLSSCSNEKKAEITSWEVPSFYREESEQKGTVEKLDYTAHDYAYQSEKTEEKYTNVYLPYGYSEEKQYDIIYLLHGTDSQSVTHQETWLYKIGVKNILDNMIARGDIEPLIVVTPSFYSYGLFGDDDMKEIKEFSQVKVDSTNNFIKELRYDLIPAVEGKYSTYADGTEEENFISSRDHRALAGLSNGCRITYLGGMVENFDYFSWFGCYSASIDSQMILNALNSKTFKQYSLNYMLNADGIYDFAYNSHKKMVKELLEDEKFNQDNVEYVQIAFGYHSARSWRVAFYDSLQRFFK